MSYKQGSYNNPQWRNNNNFQTHSYPANPQRFNDFKLLPDESGFTIPGCNFTFYFDQNGGWFDEYQNYYNANGEPCTPPAYDDEDDYHPADNWVNEYDDADDDERDELAHYDKVFLNVENKRVLGTYLKDENVEVEIRNMNFKIKEDDFEDFLVKNKIDWIEFEFEYDRDNRFKGVCYLVLDKQNTEKLIEFNSSRVFDRELKISVLKKESEEDVEDIHEIGAGINLAEVKISKEEEKLPEKPREIIFQRNQNPIGNQATEAKNVVYVEDLEKDLKPQEKIASTSNEQKSQVQTTVNKTQSEDTGKAQKTEVKSPSKNKSGWDTPLPKKKTQSQTQTQSVKK